MAINPEQSALSETLTQRFQGRERFLAERGPTHEAALCSDHFEGRGFEFGEIIFRSVFDQQALKTRPCRVWARPFFRRAVSARKHIGFHHRRRSALPFCARNGASHRNRRAISSTRVS